MKRNFIPIGVALAAAATLMVAMPAMAATKIFETNVVNVPFTSPSTNICQVSDDVVGKFTLHFTIWDQNGDGVTSDGDKLSFQSTANGKILDSVTSDKLGAFSSAGQENSIDFFSFPYTGHFNATGTCDGSGKELTFQFIFTVDNNGGIHFHSQ